MDRTTISCSSLESTLLRSFLYPSRGTTTSRLTGFFLINSNSTAFSNAAKIALRSVINVSFEKPFACKSLKFRECDWYEELVELLGSEDFGCRPVKYNYTELMNGMSDIIWGSLGQTIKDLGVEVSGVLLDDYRNGIIIRVRTEEDALKIQPMLPGDMYRIEVFNEEMWS